MQTIRSAETRQPIQLAHLATANVLLCEPVHLMSPLKPYLLRTMTLRFMSPNQHPDELQVQHRSLGSLPFSSHRYRETAISSPLLLRVSQAITSSDAASALVARDPCMLFAHAVRGRLTGIGYLRLRGSCVVKAACKSPLARLRLRPEQERVEG